MGAPTEIGVPEAGAKEAGCAGRGDVDGDPGAEPGPEVVDGGLEGRRPCELGLLEAPPREAGPS